MTKKEKQEIDEMSYSSMLYTWRFQPIGSNYFVGERGRYYSEIMHQKRDMLDTGEAVSFSKEIGWG